MTRVRFRHTEAGEIKETELVLCRPDEWADSPESQQSEWSTGNVDLTETLNGLENLAVLGPLPPIFFALSRGKLTERVALGLHAL